MSPSLEYARSQSCHSKLLSLYCDFRWARYAFTQPNFSGSGTAGSWSCDLNCSQMSHTVNLRRQTWACLNIQTQSKIAKLVPEKELNNRGTWFSVGTQGNPSSPADRPGEKCWTLHQSGQANSGPIFRLTVKFKTNSNHSIAELKLTFKFKTTALQSQEAKLRSVPALTVRPDNGHKALTHFLVEETVSQGSCCSAPCSGEAHLLLCPTRQTNLLRHPLLLRPQRN